MGVLFRVKLAVNTLAEQDFKETISWDPTDMSKIGISGKIVHLSDLKKVLRFQCLLKLILYQFANDGLITLKQYVEDFLLFGIKLPDRYADMPSLGLVEDFNSKIFGYSVFEDPRNKFEIDRINFLKAALSASENGLVICSIDSQIVWRRSSVEL
jgi:hypothetical protein